MPTKPLHLTFEPFLDRKDWTYSTAYLDGKPVATVTRRRTYEKGPAFQIHATNGNKISHAHTVMGVERRLREYLANP